MLFIDDDQSQALEVYTFFQQRMSADQYLDGPVFQFLPQANPLRTFQAGSQQAHLNRQNTK